MMNNNTFTKEQAQLIREQQLIWDSYKGKMDQHAFESDMWYVMNRSGLFEEEQWTIAHTRKYITERRVWQ